MFTKTPNSVYIIQQKENCVCYKVHDIHTFVLRTFQNPVLLGNFEFKLCTLLIYK